PPPVPSFPPRRSSDLSGNLRLPMLLQLLKQILPSVALTAAVAVTLIFIFARWWRKASDCAAAIALGGGYIAGHVLTAGWSPLPPRSATHWLFWFAVIGTILAPA